MFRMRFDFEERNVTNLNFINTALSALRLSDLKDEDSDGYLAVRTAYDPNTHQPAETAYHYGFDHLTLVCETDENDDPHTWQVDAQAFPKGEVPSSHAFHSMWHKQHPDRTMRTLTQYAFDDADAFVVLHHENRRGIEYDMHKL